MREAHTILIAGPTASGKSRLAQGIAARTRGVIVNTDSMQVYRELRVLTARPTADDEAAADYALYGHVTAATRYSVGEWLRAAVAMLAHARKEARTVIFVGGTGLYFKALTDGLAEVPPIPDEVGEAVRDEVRAKGAAALHVQLGEVDPEAAAAVRPSDTSRIVRALEVYEATGRTLTEWRRGPVAPAVIDGTGSTRIVLWPDNMILHERIAARAEAMVADGAVAEAAALLALGLDENLPAMKAIGVRELGSYIRGDTSLDEAIAAVKTETRRYAKRQLTWFRGQMRDWRWVTDPATLDLDAFGP